MSHDLSWLEEKEETEELEPPKTEIQKTPKKVLPVKKDIEIEKTELEIDKKSIKTKGSLHNIRKVLDNTNITQDDLWFLISYFTREKVSTFRESKKALEPIFKDFINKKLKGSVE